MQREEHTKKLNIRKGKKKNKPRRSKPGMGQGPALASPHAWRGARQPRGAQRLSAQFPSLSPSRPDSSGHGQPGRQGRGQGAAQQPSVHTHCAIPQQRRPSVRPSAWRRGRSDTAARRSRTPVGYRGNSGRGWRGHAPPSKPCWWGTTACRGTAGSARSGTWMGPPRH